MSDVEAPGDGTAEPGGPRRLRLIAILVVGLLVVGGGVFLLRDRLDTERTAWADPNPQQEFRAEEVTYHAAQAPSSPEGLRVDSWRPNSLRVRWDAARTEGSVAGTAYELYWAGDGRTERLVLGSNATELTGLADDARYSVELRSINALGERSEAVRATAVPSRSRVDHVEDDWSLIEDFDEPELSSQRWQPQSNRCIPEWVDGGSITADPSCWWTSIRSRAPLVLDSADAPSRGRILLLAETPAAAPIDPSAEAISGGPRRSDPPSVSLDLTPRPAIADGAPVQSTETGTAPELPPESIRLVIDADGPTLLVGPGLLDDGAAGEYGPAEIPATVGMPTQWELRVGSTQLTVLQDDVPVIRLPAEVSWREADVTLTSGRTRDPHHLGAPATVDLIAIDRLNADAATDDFPFVLAEQGVQVLPLPASSALLRTPARAELVLSGSPGRAPELELAGKHIEMQTVEHPAGGQRFWTVEIAAELLSEQHSEFSFPEPEDGGATVTAAALRLWSDPDERLAPIGLSTAEPPPSRVTLLDEYNAQKVPVATLAVSHDGQEIQPIHPWSESTEATPISRGELEITATFAEGHDLREPMDGYGMTGWELRADDEVLLRVTAHSDGPMSVGEHRLTLDTSELPPGEVEFELWTYGLEPGSDEETAGTFTVVFLE
ncbi:fibronectin type III domain-containing protein [Actinoalloteichus hymeniacidonis]|uniref:Fibronectin type III domain-containing protein n=1 Tax=Actinoalloteichus hymeniacidonis TaxID=340345 RepID=A0AAC9HKN2_9PSEU|nr:fibronectin type III domain-containing protein [Actinoalloteichus hymeniacidonis]AOS61009.1 fibronectin type III domain-containing protein [Actinoalloteichus hymeniacidonis]MBB5910991.1 hypothetical protein [Actinoalloteichus hymeniacidonis]